MIELINASKNFGGHVALQCTNCKIEGNLIYGLIGPNGAGKSTFLRLLSGVYKSDSGEVLINSDKVYENPSVKSKIAFLSDEPFFFNQHTINSQAQFNRATNPNFSEEKFKELKDIFKLNPDKKISNFSKGMKRQAAILLALSSMPEIILFDETFDGLDPMMRLTLKKIIINEMAERDVQVILSSHNLRELEDFCDHVGLLHNGKIVFERDLDDLKAGVFKVQTAFKKQPSKEELDKIGCVNIERKGSVSTLIIKGEMSEDLLAPFEPLFVDAGNLTLEEVFIYEMEALNIENGQMRDYVQTI